MELLVILDAVERSSGVKLMLFCLILAILEKNAKLNYVTLLPVDWYLG